ncbi:MAG TPA: amidophosphoribosyltransferase [Bacteroidales bacterium]|nr:MAG: amidophosphoribosyltransferase [Bacteroidetes bacterium GWE2_42_24]OFY32703.1 MAG: amidophosphoribosyltransferase [Bacteroidetes bacterium GWF2_43_11]HAQ66144.1 amidophosphoribosyltransferase [Bacteroidales bacterium]HBZ65228.1 amidophosphoribosyltransferase [Bacteroidales bacterium]
MSDAIKHECGIAMIRLRQPLEYYLGKYGTAFYGLNKLHLLMEKQHNRGQDGAGIACIKLDPPQGFHYINRLRSNTGTPIKDVFNKVYDSLSYLKDNHPARLKDVNWLKQNIEFTGELFLGHLRYGTFGKNNILNIHPFLRENNWITRNLVLAGNFNLTNVDELFGKLLELGQYPVETSDTVTILEKIGHFLDNENELLFRQFKDQGYTNREISHKIAEYLDVQRILTQSSEHWDGGYVMAGMFGHGDAFVLRDPAGIRPAYYYADDEVIVAASERPVIQTTLNVDVKQIKEIDPGKALIIKKNGSFSCQIVKEPAPRRSCSFERIYFSRGTDTDIYTERKALGRLLVPEILKIVEFDLENTVFSYIPNTAAVAYQGMIEGLNDFCTKVKIEKITALGANLTSETLAPIMALHPRSEKVAVKDIKLRTFITEDKQRDDLVAHVYDVTYGSIRRDKDRLVVIDDSIVRGTTLRQSILRILDRLGPVQIVVVSSAPQIRYPDCYGIDMSRLGDFVAFRAAMALLKEKKMESIINEVYRKSKAQEKLHRTEVINYVQEIYLPFTPQQISQKIAEILTPPELKANLHIVYQSIENLHQAIPNHKGDWYFTGEYPTPGGNKVVNKAFINFIEGRDERAY